MVEEEEQKREEEEHSGDGSLELQYCSHPPDVSVYTSVTDRLTF